jgi:hypothetical protein
MQKRAMTQVIFGIGIALLAMGYGIYTVYSINKRDTVYDSSSGQYLLPTQTPEEEADSRRKNDLVVLRNAIEMYAVDHKGDYVDDFSPLVPDYLLLVPKDPVTGESYTYIQTEHSVYSISATLSDGTIFTVTNP